VNLDVEAPATGVLLRIVVPDETETAIFSTIGIIGEPGEDISGVG
jgi:pyruvate/2-oxoglutarate dehydrogenase complex dihydrolipoamide acyltransferase (E2) component